MGMLAIMMANAGGAWDNSKKLCEKLGLKKSANPADRELQKACVVGDTVGDPFKDTSGPALNILIKLMSMVSLTVAPLLKQYVAAKRQTLPLRVLGEKGGTNSVLAQVATRVRLGCTQVVGISFHFASLTDWK